MTSDEHEISRAGTEALPMTLAQGHEVVLVLAGPIELLRQRVSDYEAQWAGLQERLKLDSKNSSKPPSPDGPASGNPAQRRANVRERGAQAGYKGSFRALFDQSQVDQVIDCSPVPVRECGAAVIALNDEPIRHQAVDVRR